MLRRVKTRSSFLSDAVHVNGPALVPTNLSPGQDGGFLGRGFEPLLIGDPTDAARRCWRFDSAAELPPIRQGDRLTLKQTLDQYASRLEGNVHAADMNRLYSQAQQMLSSAATREAFDLDGEAGSRARSLWAESFGAVAALARRLVEAGVPYINVIWNQSNRGQDKDPDDTDIYGWDTHNDIFDSLQNRLLPRFDESFSAFIEDLDQRRAARPDAGGVHG